MVVTYLVVTMVVTSKIVFLLTKLTLKWFHLVTKIMFFGFMPAAVVHFIQIANVNLE